MSSSSCSQSTDSALPNLISAMSSSGGADSKIEACLRASELTSLADIASINEKTIENLERFIRRKCSAMSVEERKKFIDDDLVNDPDRFMIAPGLSQRIINTCGKISAIYKSGGSVAVNEASITALLLSQSSRDACRSITDNTCSKIDTALSNDDQFYKNALSLASNPCGVANDAPVVANDAPVAVVNVNNEIVKYTNLNPPLIDEDDNNTDNIEIKRECHVDDKQISVSYVKQEPGLSEGYLVCDHHSFDQSRPAVHRRSRPKRHSVAAFRTNAIDYYYTKVVQDGTRFFENCKLIPKVNFDIELNVRGKVETKPCAHFVCYLCRTTIRTEKKLKFYLTEKGAIINSNIINHLKIHFSLKN